MHLYAVLNYKPLTSYWIPARLALHSIVQFSDSSSFACVNLNSNSHEAWNLAD